MLGQELAAARAMLSLPPPGEYGTTSVTGLSGNLSSLGLDLGVGRRSNERQA